MDPEDLNKDVLKSFPVIFDVEILLENWPTENDMSTGHPGV